MAFLAVNLTEATRQKMLLMMVIFNFVLILSSMGLLIVGVHIKLQVQEYVNIVNKSEGDTLCNILIVIGVFSIINCIFGIKILSDCRDVELRQRKKRLLLPFMGFSYVVCISTLASGIMCFTHVGRLHESFQTGLLEAMQKYKTDVSLKTEIDKLQTLYSCCGSVGYEDWFDISWINELYLNVESKVITVTSIIIFTSIHFSLSCNQKSFQ